MNFSKVSKTLELDKILENLKDYASAQVTKEYIDKVEISTNFEEVINRLEETRQAVNLITRNGDPPLFAIIPVKNLLKRASLGGVLSIKNLLNISDFLRVGRFLKNYLKKDDKLLTEENLGLISSFIDNLYTNRALEDSINEKIISEEEVADDASRELLSIRRSIKKLESSLKDRLEKILATNKDYLQDSLVTLREGRYVIPVKNANKGRVKGLVHDISSSGQTLYIEPMEIVNANNEIKSLKVAEREEIEKILRKLSEEVADVSENIGGNEELLIYLDFVFSKAKFALENFCYCPKINNKKVIDLKNAYHPLLDRKKAVPIDINIGRDFMSIIITGPNTGGKTVTLKTVGLLQLMVQYGLFIPANESSELSIFNKLFADIGDEQSIEQSLSTFSSHMTNIVEIIKNVDEESLVLFDELGAGTDPTEGAALARAIMDYMLQRKIRCMSTTHYNQLKIYALTTDGVQNASMEFDVNTLSPSYKLLIGLPGKSNAFEISRRLGLSSAIIEDAGKLISDENIEFEKVLASIDEDRTKTREDRFLAQREKEDLEEKNRSLKREIQKIEASKEKILADAREEARKIVLRAKENSELVLSEINDIRDQMTSENARRLQESSDILRESINALDGRGQVKLEKAANPIKEIKKGDKVRTSFGNIATVLELPDANGNVYIQSGVMKMKVPKDFLTKVLEEDGDQRQRTSNIIKNKAKNIRPEIDLRGKNFEDSKDIVDKYLDDAFLAGLKTVRLIHGKGTGVLRKKLREYLRKQKNVKSFEDANYNEGGDGVTNVHLK
ncbi:endonuclease MutS2 [Peptoniphilus raoultii]|uniref:endonuclease MutS2 n=1 Tax=Peptoniphilus raoultii TaxID=1776387 RepID=UPI0008DABDFA|nr:endonuclease MutS2 [Peptoniphilus raoultii]